MLQSTTSSAQYLPTAANMTGDFSASNPLSGTATHTICGVPNQYTGQLCDPLTGVPVPGNNYNNAGAPPFVKNPASVALYPHLPAPTPSGKFQTRPLERSCIRFRKSMPITSSFVRGDYTINSKNNFLWPVFSRRLSISSFLLSWRLYKQRWNPGYHRLWKQRAPAEPDLWRELDDQLEHRELCSPFRNEDPERSRIQQRRYQRG